MKIKVEPNFPTQSLDNGRSSAYDSKRADNPIPDEWKYQSESHSVMVDGLDAVFRNVEDIVRKVSSPHVR